VQTAGIFISYRRDDSRHAAGRLADDLADTFGEAAIFRDIEGIDPGVDFTRALEKALAGCVVMLVLIGPRWLDLRDPQGRRRLDQPGDWIRQEIATALQRDVRVIPLLLEGTPMPDPEQLPADLRPLVQRQWLELEDGRWRGDVQRLEATLARVPGLQRRAPAAPAAEGASAAGRGPSTSAAGAPWSPPAAPAPTRRTGGRFGTLVLGAVIGVVGLLAAIVYSEFAPDDGDVALPSTTALPMPATAGDAAAPAAPPAVSTEGREVPDVAGLWRTASGETYHFEQDGAHVRFVARAGGQPMGQGEGQFEGGLLRLSFTMHVGGVAIGTANCDLQAGPDRRSFTGGCVGPNGPFVAQMFR
jgi:hypothetical protein